MNITVIIPAHNEESSIGATIESVLAQTRAPDYVLVVCDNCEDATEEVASRYPVAVMRSVNNKGRKAGALNQALDRVMPGKDRDDLLLMMDADTVLTPNLIQNAVRHFRQDPALGALSSNHLIMEHHNLLELLQAMEYERDRRVIGRKQGRVGCMTGMAAVFRVAALRDVGRAFGAVYDPQNITEDWKLTLALKQLGWGTIRPQDCEVATIPVSRLKGLFKQRERWAHGYLQTLREFGWTRVTKVLWLKQAGMLFSILIRLMFFALLAILIVNHAPLVSWWMVPVAAIFALDAVHTVYRVGPKAVIVAAIFPIEVAYTWLLTAAIVSGYFKNLANINGQWDRVRG
jgi:poly-beta-1,6-N-acetyl-D-glucosamine synthase